MQLSQEDGDFPPHLKILIADKHALVRRGLRECLRDFLAEAGLTPHIVETSSAHDAIAQIHAATWNLVILDLNLPDMPGLEILRILKSVQPAAAALVLSIYTEEHYAARAVRAGALGYLTKDRGPEELRSAVSKLLQGEPYRHADAEARHQYRGPHKNALRADSHPPALSDREFEVLQWIVQGRRLTDIAGHLKLSIKTVSTYRTRLLTKLGLKTTADLVRYALDQHLV